MTKNTRALLAFCGMLVIVVIIKVLFMPAGMDVTKKPAKGSPHEGETAKEDKKMITDITPSAAKMNMEKDKSIVLLDVRTPEEYKERHIPGSKLLPLDKPEAFIPALTKLVPDKSTIIYVYCRSGRRSREAVDMMQVAGFSNVFNLGGIKDWPFETE